MTSSYALPPAEPVAEPRDFVLVQKASTIGHIPLAEATRRAGILRHELDDLEAARRAVQADTALTPAARYDASTALRRQIDATTHALRLYELQRRYGRAS